MQHNLLKQVKTRLEWEAPFERIVRVWALKELEFSTRSCAAWCDHIMRVR